MNKLQRVMASATVIAILAHSQVVHGQGATGGTVIGIRLSGGDGGVVVGSTVKVVSHPPGGGEGSGGVVVGVWLTGGEGMGGTIISIRLSGGEGIGGLVVGSTVHVVAHPPDGGSGGGGVVVGWIGHGAGGEGGGGVVVGSSEDEDEPPGQPLEGGDGGIILVLHFIGGEGTTGVLGEAYWNSFEVRSGFDLSDCQSGESFQVLSNDSGDFRIKGVRGESGSGAGFDLPAEHSQTTGEDGTVTDSYTFSDPSPNGIGTYSISRITAPDGSMDYVFEESSPPVRKPLCPAL